ncbi:SRPBCC domain-containing protein [Rhodococcus sp. NPDC058514]|uniref:SRPBCC family protein n=1 Tax=unclassified Rhodococcus (in: high G+C Gram-positive bacteria) TaxID=192944 RepID=UPI003668D51B
MIADAELNPAAVEIGSFFPQSPDAVWRALTEPDLLERWMTRSIGFVASVGTQFVLEVPTQPTGEIACEVLVARPGEQLKFSWADLRAEDPARWVVDWMLHPQGCGTRFLLTQTGFDIDDRRQKMARNALERGWKVALLRLRDVLDGVES